MKIMFVKRFVGVVIKRLNRARRGILTMKRPAAKWPQLPNFHDDEHHP